MRCFIAISLPGEIKDRLHQIQTLIRRKHDIQASYPSSKNLHLTLIFLGVVPLASQPSLASIMDDISRKIDLFPLCLSRLGTFPGKSRFPRILWVGLNDETKALKRIHSDLKSRLISEGFKFNPGTFSPHITLARFKRNPGQLPLTEVTKESDWTGLSFEVKEIDLYKSDLLSQGALHTRLHTSSIA